MNIIIRQFITNNKRSIALFCLVGATTALLNFSVFGILWNLLQINYRFAVTCSYILSALFHFTANRRFTFKSHGTDLHAHAFKYLIMILINYTITMCVMYIVVEILTLSPYFGVACSITATFGTGYLLAKYWVFRNRLLSA